MTVDIDHSFPLSCPIQAVPLTCKHCRSPIPTRTSQAEFCCQGCEAVYYSIHRLGLGRFYQLLASRAIAKAEGNLGELLELYDKPEFVASFSQLRPDNRVDARLFVRGLDCYACIWLIQSYMEQQCPAVDLALSVSESEMTVTYDPAQIRLSTIVAELHKIGFQVQPEPSSGGGRGRAEDLTRIGINAFCFINVMMLAFPDYIDENLIRDFGFWQLFRYISLGLTTIVMTYGALPFYRSSIASIKARRANVDLPISLALVLAFGYSAVNTIVGDGPVYFDSVAIVITLILTSRYFHGAVVRRAERAIRGRFDFSFDYVKQDDAGSKRIIPAARLMEGDGYYVVPGDPVPVQSLVEGGRGQVNYGQMTGESECFDVGPGSEIRSGGVVTGSRLELRALENGDSSYIARVKKTMAQVGQDRGRYAQLSDRLGSIFFLAVVLVASGILLHFWSVSPEIALQRTVAALLIACPCAFALSVPLTMTMCTALGAKRGIIFKNQRAIEALGRVTRVFFDKTGTLTSGIPRVLEFSLCEDALLKRGFTVDEVLAILSGLESHCSHHVVAALAERFDPDRSGRRFDSQDKPVVKEEIGLGLQFSVRGSLWVLGKRQYCQLSKSRDDENYNVFLTIDGDLAASFVIDDRILPDAKATIAALVAKGIDVGMISGDGNQRTLLAAKSLGIPEERVYAEQTPFEKLHQVHGARGQVTAMVGNGFNDSLALSASDVGVSVSSSSQKAKEAAGVSIEFPGISPLVQAINLSHVALKKVVTSFAFAVGFNIIGLSLAMLGLMTPVMAAILMPCSSIIVTLVSIRWPATFGSGEG